MSWNQRNRVGQQTTGVVGLTGAAPQTVTGKSLLMRQVQPGTLAAEVYGLAGTSGMIITGKWQVSNDNSTWRDAFPSNHAANVTYVSTAGTTTATTVESAPDAVYAKRWARYVLTTSVAVGGGAAVDEGSVAYAFMAPTSVG